VFASNHERRALLVCIGNELVADDGVGWAVYKYLRESRLPDCVRLVFLGLGGIDLLEEIAGEELLVVIDGVQLGALPGTLHLLGWDQLPATSARPVSGHGIGIREAITVGRKLYPERVPKEIFLLGVEGRCFDQLGTGLSGEVALAVPEAAAAVLALVNSRSCMTNGVKEWPSL
jgi:hydrogenase maturation protease